MPWKQSFQQQGGTFRALMWITILVFTKNGYSRNFIFYILHILKWPFYFFINRSNCFRLVNGQAFKQPTKLLSGKWSDLRSISGPLKTTVTIQSLIQQAESILIEIQSFQRISSSSTKEIKSIGVWIHLISIPDDCHQAINTASHVGRTRHAVDSGNPGDIA